jgi:hypothetical protein
MLEAVRHATGLPDSHPDYDDARLRIEISDTLRTVFGVPIVKAKAGYWLQPHTGDMVSGTSVYQIPGRSMAQGLKSIEVRQSSTDDYYPLDEISFEMAGRYDTRSGKPAKYVVYTDFVRIVPKPDSSNYDFRMWYYLRPADLVEEQTTSGIITSLNTSTRVALMALTPADRDTGNDITSSSTVDVVSTVGAHETHLVGASLSAVASDTSVTFASGTDLSRVVVGDAVRAAGQTDWPMLPQEFHRTLADVTGAVILAGGIGAVQKAGGLTGKAGDDYKRFIDLLEPRVKDNARKLIPRVRPGVRGRFGTRWPVASS